MINRIRNTPFAGLIGAPLRALRLVTVPAALATLLFASSAAAQPAATGSIEGRVENVDTGKYLNNARIRITGTNRETFTNEFGEYRLRGVPAGEAHLDVFYTGLQSQQLTVNVPAGGTAQQDVSLTGVIQLSQFVVQSQRETDAAAIAINEQRFSPNLKNVVSTDAYGEINQGNIGEFVKHMPGVNIEFKDGNNPSGIDIRGFGTNYTRVTTDGNQMASAAIANTQTPNRQFVLEGATINNIARIEVTKEPLPDTPANSMGGSVNLVTKSAFEYAHQETSFEAYLSGNSNALGLGKRGGIASEKKYTVLPSFDGTIVLPVNKTLGIVVSAANYDQYYTKKQSSPKRVFNKDGSNPYTQAVSYSISPNEVQSTSGSIKLDWKPWRGNLLSVTASALAYRQDSASRTVNYSINAKPADWGEDYSHGPVGGTKGSNSMGNSFQNRNALTRFVGANYEFDRGPWDIKLAATYSNANNRVRDTDKGMFNSLSTALHATNNNQPGFKGATVNFDGIENSTGAVQNVTVLDSSGNAVDTTQLANYDLTGVGSQPMTAQDTVTEFRGDFRRNFDFRLFPFAVQAGGSTNNLVRDIEYSSQSWTYVGPDGKANSGDESLAAFADPNYSGSPGFGMPSYQWASPWLVFDTFKQHPEYFTQSAGNIGDKIKNEAVRSPLLMERVSAGYVMGDTRLFNNRLRLVGGVRYELTQDRGYGYRQNGDAIYQKDANGKVIFDSKGKPILLPSLAGTASGGPEQASLIYIKRGIYNARNYHDYFPSADATINITENLLFRAAFAKTTGRPSPSDIVPNSYVGANTDPNTVGVTPGYITSSNTSLVPWTAKNYDLSLEYYLPHSGVASIGVFRKDIRNFFGTIHKIADEALLDSLGLSHDLVGYDWSTRINVGDARIDGVEASYSQQLTYIPVVGQYLTATANMTKLRVTGAYASSFDLKSGGGNIPTTGNAGLRFHFKRFAADVFWNYRGRQFRDTSGAFTNARENVRAVQTWDADMSYAITKHFSAFVSGHNNNNAINRWSLDGPGAPEWAAVETAYTNGAQYSLGVRGTF